MWENWCGLSLSATSTLRNKNIGSPLNSGTFFIYKYTFVYSSLRLEGDKDVVQFQTIDNTTYLISNS